MTDWITAIEGTETGRIAAMVLALTAAFLHALFGALQKGRYDPWTSRVAIDAGLVVLSAPIALFLVPWPEPSHWWIYVGVVLIHLTYKSLMAATYDRGAYTVVYPVVRGTAPVFTVLGAGAIFGEVFSAGQWLGVALLVGGMFGLSVYNMRKIVVARETLIPALGFAVATGLSVALYTTWDAYGIRVEPNPFTFIAWFFFLSSLDFPLIALVRRGWRWPEPALIRLGGLGAVIGWGSFGSVMLATRLDSVGEAAILRETSTVFAALIGWIVLKESVGPRRLGLMALIALGAVVVEFGG
ncbi:phosphonate utilization associated putative membrane protein [Jannaschia seosinensis]|uniref:Phosphonate utilization associated putative membrane protein n=1 Tax=Jannaschia seosinensis TaxID=313367 RepID=A0A0M7BC01_9RHOB|nr:DMT family transporter [Jannaschia seosinensis]CUH40317.1 phosphonate utilization associated putative membrane protein [Jannaschia seosinensis]